MERSTSTSKLDINGNELCEEMAKLNYSNASENVQSNDSSKMNETREMTSIFQNIDKEDLIRGTTPKDIEERCLSLCQEYVGGSWCNASSVADIEVKRISGGLTNQLYHVSLKEGVARVENRIYSKEPHEVAIKLYQKKHMKSYCQEYERLNDTIISTIVSELNIGPTIYGIFNDGVIQAYCKHEQFRPKHQQNDTLLRKLGHILAKIHALKVPVPKKGNFIMTQLREFVDEAYDMQNFQQTIEELQLDEFIKKDFRKEYTEFEDFIEKYNAPSVFCHNDFRGSNILVLTESTDDKQPLVMCDFEYSSYGPRGYDLGVYMTEWDKELVDMFSEKLPSEDQIKHFARFYVEGCDLIDPEYSTRPGNSVEDVVRDTKVGIFMNYMFFIAFLIKQRESLVESIPFDLKANLIYTNKFYKVLQDIKQKLINDGIYK